MKLTYCMLSDSPTIRAINPFLDVLVGIYLQTVTLCVIMSSAPTQAVEKIKTAAFSSHIVDILISILPIVGLLLIYHTYRNSQIKNGVSVFWLAGCRNLFLLETWWFLYVFQTCMIWLTVRKPLVNVSVYMKMPFQTSEDEAHNNSFISVIQVNKLVFVCLYELSIKKTFTLQICWFLCEWHLNLEPCGHCS